MTRKELKKEQKKKYDGRQVLQLSEIVEYLKRLITIYKKDGKEYCFWDQFNAGSGNELKEKFWSVNSSSRLAFDMYSWLANMECVKDIQFEYKLVGICKGNRGVPNIDVYIENDKDEIYFIESKFTESYKQAINTKILPAAYWKEHGDKDAKTTDGKPLGSELIDRYKGDKCAMEEFITLIQNTISNLEIISNKEKPKCWMEFGQEIKHLYGIYFLINTCADKEKYKNKIIKFYNVYYDLEEPTNDAINKFFNQAEDMMNKLLKGKIKEFVYEYKTVQNLVKDFPDEEAFEFEGKIKQLLKDKYFIK